MMKWAMRLTFAVTVGLLVLVSSLSYQSNRTLVERGLRADASHTTLLHLDGLLLAIDQLRHAEPGSWNTTDSNVRSSFIHASEIAIHGQFVALQAEPHLDEAKKRKLDTIHDRFEAAMDEAKGPLREPGEGSVEPRDRAAQDLLSSEIETIVDEIRTIERAEGLEIERLTESLRASAKRVLASLLVATSVAIIALTFSLLVIRREMRGRAQARAQLERANAELETRLDELQRRSVETELLTDLGEVLQACSELGETAAIISSYLPRLFPGTSGAIYVKRASNNGSDLLSAWGLETPLLLSLARDECWAIRSGRIHRFGSPSPNVRCQHVSGADISSICIPMQAEGESFGILHIESSSQRMLERAADRLYKSVSEQLSLGLANIQLRDSLRTRAIHDPLTGLFNRRYMEESLEREIMRAERHQFDLAVSMIDVDHFKMFNDTFGHAAGDAVLQQLGALLQTSFRGEDIVCRYGGEEFVVILTNTAPKDAVARIERLRESVKRLAVRHCGETLGPVSISAGVALYPIHGHSIDAIIGTADSFLYRAKAEGRDRVVHDEDSTARLSPRRPLLVTSVQ
ncbi:MAG: diguanylate cyclase [Thermoanaerobaculia bacterium]